MKYIVKNIFLLSVDSLKRNPSVIAIGIIGVIRTILAMLDPYVHFFNLKYPNTFSYGFIAFAFSFALCSGILRYRKNKKEGIDMKKSTFKTTEEITKKFIEYGWTKDISFSELTLEEAKEKGYLFAIHGIADGHKYFRMNETGNIYDESGKLLMFNI